MTDTLIKFAGKTPSNTASAVKVNADGQILTERVWKAHSETLINRNVSSKTTVSGKSASSIGNNGLVSLRVSNATSSRLRIQFLTDEQNSNEYMLDANGDRFGVDLPANGNYILTPDDIPILNYLRYVNIAATTLDTPEAEANITVIVICKG